MTPPTPTIAPNAISPGQNESSPTNGLTTNKASVAPTRTPNAAPNRAGRSLLTPEPDCSPFPMFASPITTHVLLHRRFGIDWDQLYGMPKGQASFSPDS